MPQQVVALLVQYPILTLFLVIGLGYIVGEIGIFGFRFGVAGVLFVGLAIGAFDRSIALPDVIPTLGLIIFVYTIGIQSGPALGHAFRQRGGFRDNMLAVGVLVFGALLTLGLSYWLSIPGPRAAGLFCGSLTSTPALAAARDAVREAAAGRGIPHEQARLEVTSR
jgi:putative transport protein